MIETRRLLYHYCSTESGFNILKSRTIRLSALSAANDTLEGHVVGQVLTRMLAETALPPGVRDVASLIVEGYPYATEGFAFCLSEQGDLLSQWRAYADNGGGVSIGFDREVLAADFGDVSFGARHYEIVKVSYGDDALTDMLRPVVEQLVTELSPYSDFVRIKEGVSRKDATARLFGERNVQTGLLVGDQGSKKPLSALLKIVSSLHFKIYETKPRTFFEEQEWRLLRHHHRVPLACIEYAASGQSIRPFVTCLMADPAKEAIKRVILGPRHRSHIDWVKAFLASVGLDHVEVLRSTAESYR